MSTQINATPLSPVAALVDGMLDLVPLPQAYIRIRQVVDDAQASLREIADVVGSDPALTARVLRLANSAYFSLSSPVDSIEHAVRVLGMNQVHDMALAMSAVGSLSHLRADTFDIHTFWRMSIYAAVSARNFAVDCRLPVPSRLFVAGLMHNIGNLVIAHELPQAFAECRQQACASERPYHEVQRATLGYDYADVGAELMRQWRLPEALVEPVALHTRPVGEVAPEHQLVAAVMQMAATTARASMWQSAESEPIPDFEPQAVSLTQQDEDAIEAHMQRVDGEVIEFIAILMPKV